MSDDIIFRLNRKSRIFIYVILGIGISVALFLTLSPSTTLEQREALTNFLLALVALEIGVMLFLIHRRFPVWRKFVDSMTLLILFMAPVGFIVPLLLSYHATIYYLLPTFLIGWLFFTQHIIYGKNNWKEDRTKKWILLPWYLLIGGFFIGAIALVVAAPNIPNWIS